MNTVYLSQRVIVFWRQAKNISSMVKQKRKEKAGKWEVPLPAVKAQSEAEVFKILKSGQSRNRTASSLRLFYLAMSRLPISYLNVYVNDEAVEGRPRKCFLIRKQYFPIKILLP